MVANKPQKHRGTKERLAKNFYTTPLKKDFESYRKITSKMKRQNVSNSVDYRNPESDFFL
ncbi:MAG: hypothetical protein C4538_06170 [Nitrospiraceae bacterium]|nr:MAG: hypothetical protein C4538_06170 [Nitrospiraceae bacterium]